MRKKDLSQATEFAKRLERSTLLHSGGEMAIVAKSLKRELDALAEKYKDDLAKPHKTAALTEYDRCRQTLKAFQHLQKQGGAA